MLQIKKLADFRRFGCLKEHLVIRLCLVTLSRLNTLRLFCCWNTNQLIVQCISWHDLKSQL